MVAAALQNVRSYLSLIVSNPKFIKSRL